MLRAVVVGVFAVFAGLVPARAWAMFHLMKVREVYAGSVSAPNAQYVELQMYSANQTSVMGHKVTVFSANGTLIGTFTFAANVAGSGATQSTILVATTEAATFFGVVPDLVMSTASIARGGGKACFDAIPEDCVAWGNYSGSAMGVGTPISPSGLPFGKAITRKLDVAGGATTLEATDDRDQSSNDFKLAVPAPKTNAGVSGTIPASTCGNGTIESLEQCDDHNTTSNDGCSATCETDAAVFDAGVPDAMPVGPDAAPGTPDAAPGTPDATLGNPDATLGNPDASPGQPDAALGTPVSDSSGCGCRVAGRSDRDASAPLTTFILLGAFGGLALRRRAIRRTR
jgi:cysteine-rich repeat protein